MEKLIEINNGEEDFQKKFLLFVGSFLALEKRALNRGNQRKHAKEMKPKNKK